MPFGDDDGVDLDLEVQNGGTDGAGSDAGESNAAPASEAAGETKDDGLLSVIRDVVSEKKPEAAAASPAEGEEGKGDEPDPNAPKKQDDEDYSDVPFNKHPRFRRLLEERNANRADAAEYRNVQTFMREQGLTAQEAGDLLVTGALAKRDPVQAWKLVLPWVQNLAHAAGEVLPPELAQMVQDGAMTQEAAFEVSRSRASVAANTATRSFEQQRAEATAQERESAALVDTVQSWKAERFERDPNFGAKSDAVHKEIVYRDAIGQGPKTQEEIRPWLDAIYRDVTAAMAPATPAPASPRDRRAMKPVTGGSVAGNARSAPRNMLEVVQQASAGA